MTDSRIRLRAPWLAALLTFLVPGLGQLFQGRIFKGLVYGICISGMFYVGGRMSDWKAVQAPPFQYRFKNKTLLLLKFAAQFGVGSPSLGAMLQTRRYLSADNSPPRSLSKPITAPFQGILTTSTIQGRTEKPVTGTVTLEPVRGALGETIAGSFAGKSENGESVELQFDENVFLDRPIQADKLRAIRGVTKSADGGRGELAGGIERPVQDWLGVPLTDDEEQALEGRLGKWHELAVVLTWIAGLLNVLAIWDALEGPAYGYNDDPLGNPEGPAPKPVPPRPATAQA